MTAGSGIKVGYVALWLPEPSQTFVLDEVNTLWDLGQELEVFTLYGPRSPRRLAGLPALKPRAHHLGTRCAPRILASLAQAPACFGSEALPFLARVLARRWRSLETAGEAFWAALAGVHLARLLLQRGIGHVHASWANGPATAAWVASRLSGIPFSFCARAHDIYPPDGALQEKLAAAAFVRTENDANRRYLAELVPGAAGKLETIYNGVPLRVEYPAAPADPPPFQILALGRLVIKKGFAVLLEACRLLARTPLNFHLTLAGDGPEMAHLQALIRTCELEDRVTLPGFVNRGQVSRLLSASHLFVMPSIVAPGGDRDGTPTVVAEALLHEVPVVATRVCGIPEMVQDGDTGWLVPPEDPEALAGLGGARRRARQGGRLMREQFDSRQNYRRLMDRFAAAAFGR